MLHSYATCWIVLLWFWFLGSSKLFWCCKSSYYTPLRILVRPSLFYFLLWLSVLLLMSLWIVFNKMKRLLYIVQSISCSWIGFGDWQWQQELGGTPGCGTCPMWNQNMLSLSCQLLLVYLLLVDYLREWYRVSNMGHTWMLVLCKLTIVCEGFGVELSTVLEGEYCFQNIKRQTWFRV